MNGIGQWNLVQYLIQVTNSGGTAVAGAILAGGVVLCMVIPYLLGSLNFGLIISKKAYKDDVRHHGSGNAGTTNMLRTYGKKAAILTLAGDMLKAVVAMLFGYFILTLNVVSAEGATATDPLGAAIAGLFVMLGHMFPCFFKFKGGKGVATAAMVVLMINPITFLICAAVFFIIVIGTKFVSLGSMMGMILYPVVLNAFTGTRLSNIFSIAMALLVVWAHRTNIKRLLAGEESKISLKKKKTAPDAESAPTEEKQDEGEKEYDFVTCTGCDRLIPVSREVCAYCKTKNLQYRPELLDTKNKKKRKK